MSSVLFLNFLLAELAPMLIVQPPQCTTSSQDSIYPLSESQLGSKSLVSPDFLPPSQRIQPFQPGNIIYWQSRLAGSLRNKFSSEEAIKQRIILALEI